MEELNKYLKAYKVKIVTKKGISSLVIDGKIKGKLSPGELLLKDAITDNSATGTVKIVNGDDDTQVGGFKSKGNNTIDVGDFGKVGAGGITVGEIIAHESTESFLSAKSRFTDDYSSFLEAHTTILTTGVGGLIASETDKNGNIIVRFIVNDDGKITGQYINNTWWKESESGLTRPQQGLTKFIFKYETPIPASEVEKHKPAFTELKYDKTGDPNKP